MKALENKIKRITGDSSRTDILALHEKLNAAEDAAQESYNSEMAKIHAARELLNDNSNKTAETEG